MGADVSQLMVLLSKDFVRLVGVAVLIALPIGWFLMRRWLEYFACRTDISPFIFIGAALTALLTVSYLAYKAALSNPITSLRNE